MKKEIKHNNILYNEKDLKNIVIEVDKLYDKDVDILDSYITNYYHCIKESDMEYNIIYTITDLPYLRICKIDTINLLRYNRNHKLHNIIKI